MPVNCASNSSKTSIFRGYMRLLWGWRERRTALPWRAQVEKQSAYVPFTPLAAPHKNSALTWTAGGLGRWCSGTPAGVGGGGTLGQLAALRYVGRRFHAVSAVDQAAAAQVVRKQGVTEAWVAVLMGWSPGCKGRCTLAANTIDKTGAATPPLICRQQLGQHSLVSAVALDAQQSLTQPFVPLLGREIRPMRLWPPGE